MKRTIIYILIIFLIILFASCAISPTADDKDKDKSFTDISIDDYLNTVKLPDNFLFAFDAEAISSIDSAIVYQAGLLSYDKDLLKEIFIKADTVEELIFAEGPQIHGIINNISEYLNLNDGGVTFESNGVDQGDIIMFNYIYDITKNGINSKLPTVASPYCGMPDINAQLYGYSLNSDYTSQTDLSFMTYGNVEKDISDFLDSIGLPNTQIYETYSLDWQTMKKHNDIYLELEPEQESKYEFTLDDECYIMSLRQVVDDIPIVNTGWFNPSGQELSAAGDYMPATVIQTIYSKDGIIFASLQQAYKISEEKEQVQLVNFPAAMQVLLDEYSLVILSDEVKLISAELCYISVPDADEFELRPAWIFCLAKQFNESDGNVFYGYRYDVVDAVTAKLYKGRW